MAGSLRHSSHPPTFDTAADDIRPLPGANGAAVTRALRRHQARNGVAA